MDNKYANQFIFSNTAKGTTDPYQKLIDFSFRILTKILFQNIN